MQNLITQLTIDICQHFRLPADTVFFFEQLGIGGLLAMTEDSGSHSYYHCDGNGNVTCLLNTNQLIVGQYLYDSFGNLLRMSGPKAPLSPYRFASKPRHEPSGKIDFLLRWYDPGPQTFVNADPLGEAGGLNLFQFVYNDPINSIDPFGLMEFYPGWLDLNKIVPDDFVGPLPNGYYRDSEAQAMANRNGLQTSLLGELLIPSGVGLLARTPSRCIPKAAKGTKGIVDVTSKGRTVEEALTTAQKWLGPGYKEIGKPGSGVYRSADGLRQFRMSATDVAGGHGKIGPHVHFEKFDAAGEKLKNIHTPLSNP